MSIIKGKYLLIIFLWVPLVSAKDLLVGYVNGGVFYPLAVSNNQGVKAADYNKDVVPSNLATSFERVSKKIELGKGTKYKDIYSDEVGIFYEVNGGNISKGIYFASSNRILEFSLPEEREGLIKRFYRYFSNDRWGRNFVEESMLNLTLDSIERNSGVIVHAITDIDDDNYQEVWVSFRLMYGEVGAMVYEETEGGSWVSIANHCFNCD